jgi:ABC-type antimicrobial peptide transport system permease subunit
VVGVVADIKHEDVTADPVAEVIVPFSQVPAASINFVVRLDQALYAEPMRFAPLLRRSVAEVNSGLAVFQPAGFDQIMTRRLSMRRLSMILLIAFAVLALSLAAVGIYGVLAFSVEQRTQEIGLRMALGASATDVVGSVVREAMVLAGIGVVGGVAASLALTRFAQSILFGVKATDPAVFVGIAVLLSSVAMAAAYVPARRATRVDPVVALRCD